MASTTLLLSVLPIVLQTPANLEQLRIQPITTRDLAPLVPKLLRDLLHPSTA